MGNVEVPLNALYGAQTQRAVKNFPISDIKFDNKFIYAIVIIKRSAAIINNKLKLLNSIKKNAIVKACDNVLSGKYNLTHSLIAESVSKSRTEISNKLRLLKLPPIIKQGLKNSEIEYGHARALLGIKQSTIMLKIFKKIIKNKLNVRQAEQLIRNFKAIDKKKLKFTNFALNKTIAAV